MNTEECKNCRHLLTIRNERTLRLRRICRMRGKVRIEKVKHCNNKMETSKEEFVEVDSLNDYQRRAMTTCMPSSRNIGYMVYGLCEESGEVAGKISKAIRKGFVEIDNNSLTYTNTTEEKIEEFNEALKKELGDVAWMLAGACSVMGWKLSDICNGNLNKLADRQKRNVIDGSGDTR